MKRLFILGLTCISLAAANGFDANAQQRPSMYGDVVNYDVKMNYVYSFEEALLKAKKEKKLIFFNCFADWAVPCHGMNKAVFSDADFAKYMDKTFVNLFIDVTTEEGKPLAERYGVETFCHYLILDSNGEVVHRVVGGAKLPEFKDRVAMALNPKTSLAGTEAAYNKGDRSKKTLINYLHAINLSNGDKFDEVMKEYLPLLSKKEYSKKENWLVVRKLMDDRGSEMYNYVLEHRAEFEKNVGKEEVTTMIERTFTMDLYELVTGAKPYDANRMLSIFTDMQKASVSETSLVSLLYKMSKLRGENKVEELLQLIDANGEALGAFRPSIEESLHFEELTESQKTALIAYFRAAALRHKGASGERQFTQMADALEFDAGIKFEENLTLQQCLDKAAAEGKLVFIDCYTSWCGPCRNMASNVFTQVEVGKYFNEHFVNIKMDMEKGDGPAIGKKYNVSAYPTMMILEPSGRVAWRIVGGRNAQVLLSTVKTIEGDLSKGYEVNKEAYEVKGDRSVKTVTNYVTAMLAANELDDVKASALLTEYVKGMDDAQFSSAELWPVLKETVTEVDSPEFQRILSLHSELVKNVGEENVNRMIEGVIFPVVIDYYRGKVGVEDMMKHLAPFKSASYPESFTLKKLADIVPLHQAGNIANVVAYYRSNVMSLESSRDRLNLDIMLGYLVNKDTTEADRKLLSTYVGDILLDCDPRAKRGYLRLLKTINGEDGE